MWAVVGSDRPLSISFAVTFDYYGVNEIAATLMLIWPLCVVGYVVRY